jgi:hypothetical protein
VQDPSPKVFIDVTSIESLHLYYYRSLDLIEICVTASWSAGLKRPWQVWKVQGHDMKSSEYTVHKSSDVLYTEQHSDCIESERLYANCTMIITVNSQRLPMNTYREEQAGGAITVSRRWHSAARVSRYLIYLIIWILVMGFPSNQLPADRPAIVLNGQRFS